MSAVGESELRLFPLPVWQPVSEPGSMLIWSCWQVADWCLKQDIGLVVVGPEAPLVAGLCDDLRAAGIRYSMRHTEMQYVACWPEWVFLIVFLIRAIFEHAAGLLVPPKRQHSSKAPKLSSR